MGEVQSISFAAQIHKVQTLVDGGLRVTVNLSEHEILAAAQLMECKRRGVPGRLTFEPDWSVLEEVDEPESRKIKF